MEIKKYYMEQMEQKTLKMKIKHLKMMKKITKNNDYENIKNKGMKNN